MIDCHATAYGRSVLARSSLSHEVVIEGDTQRDSNGLLNRTIRKDLIILGTEIMDNSGQLWSAAVATMVLAFATGCHCNAFYTVGIGSPVQWVTSSNSTDYQAWASERVFHVNDTLYFQYDHTQHNVLVVQTFEEILYCNATRILALGTRGATEITLATDNAFYYIMSLVGDAYDCAFGGMRFLIRVGYNCSSNNQTVDYSPSPAPSSVTDSCSQDNGGQVLMTENSPRMNVTNIPWMPNADSNWSSLVVAPNSGLVFKFSENSDKYRVYRVQEDGYTQCNSFNGTELEFGSTTVFSEPGVYYFIDGNRTLCQNGSMRLKVTVDGETTSGTSRGSTKIFNYTMLVSVLLGVSGVAIGIAGCILCRCRKRITAKRRYKLQNLIDGESYNNSDEKTKGSQDKQLQDGMMREKSGIKTCKLFTLKELEVATSKFSKKNELGSGGFGTVYKGHLNDGQLVAVKRAMYQRPTEVEQYLNEVSVLSQVNHCNLVKLLGCCLDLRVPLLVYEFVPNGTLQEHLSQSQQGQSTTLNWGRRFNIAIQTAEALKYLHSQAKPPIVHRDVKAANILLENDFGAKVADFGLSKLVETGATHVSTAVKGTPGYLDPEYYYTSQLTDKVDVYSYGMVLLELITSKKPVDLTLASMEQNLAVRMVPLIINKRVRDIIDTQLLHGLSEEEFETVEAVAEVAVACLVKERASRPSMTEVVEMLQRIRGSKVQADSFFRSDGIPVENSRKVSDDWIFNTLDSIGESSDRGTEVGPCMSSSSVDAQSPIESGQP